MVEAGAPLHGLGNGRYNDRQALEGVEKVWYSKVVWWCVELPELPAPVKVATEAALEVWVRFDSSHVVDCNAGCVADCIPDLGLFTIFFAVGQGGWLAF